MTFYRDKIAMFYDERMCPPDVDSVSKSPTKPRRFMEYLGRQRLLRYLDMRTVERVTFEQLRYAHTAKYIHAVLEGVVRNGAESNCIGWTRRFAESVMWTNGSLVTAVRAALAEPATIAMSPTSGFHHATPTAGSGFCTFSGQVIAAVDVFKSSGKRGAWIDLDGHYGNSIPDSWHLPHVKEALPWNINPAGGGLDYLTSLSDQLGELGKDVRTGGVDYVCMAHGADSHEWDDLGGQVTTGEWLTASDIVYSHVDSWSRDLGRPVPLVLTLFGGYRDDDPDSVLGLHAMDLVIAYRTLTGLPLAFTADIRRPRGRPRR